MLFLDALLILSFSFFFKYIFTYKWKTSILKVKLITNKELKSIEKLFQQLEKKS